MTSNMRMISIDYQTKKELSSTDSSKLSPHSQRKILYINVKNVTWYDVFRVECLLNVQSRLYNIRPLDCVVCRLFTLLYREEGSSRGVTQNTVPAQITC